MLWILQDNFSQGWNFIPSSFYKCSNEFNKDQKEMLDKYAINVIGEDPGEFGYVKIEGEADIDADDTNIVFCCDTEIDLEFVYRKICEAFLQHPGVLDLRGCRCRIM